MLKDYLVLDEEKDLILYKGNNPFKASQMLFLNPNSETIKLYTRGKSNKAIFANLNFFQQKQN